MSIPSIDLTNILVELFDREVQTDVPGHLLMTLRTSRNGDLARFMGSDALTKMYVFQVLREKANERFNAGFAREALTLYSSVK